MEEDGDDNDDDDDDDDDDDCNNGCTKAPLCYVIRILPFLLSYANLPHPRSSLAQVQKTGEKPPTPVTYVCVIYVGLCQFAAQ